MIYACNLAYDCKYFKFRHKTSKCTKTEFSAPQKSVPRALVELEFDKRFKILFLNLPEYFEYFEQGSTDQNRLGPAKLKISDQFGPVRGSLNVSVIKNPRTVMFPRSNLYFKVNTCFRSSNLEWINFGRFISKEFLPNIKRFLPPSYLSNETIQN